MAEINGYVYAYVLFWKTDKDCNGKVREFEKQAIYNKTDRERGQNGDIISQLTDRQEPEKAPLRNWWQKEKGYIYVDTGAMYRGMAIYFLEKNISPEDTETIAADCKNVSNDRL